jgi:galactokinase
VRSQSVFAPARVNLIGDHTDYSGGFVLPVAIHLGTTVAWKPNTGRGSVRVYSRAFNETVEVSVDGGPLPQEGWGRYLSAIVRLLHERGRAEVGLDAVVSSTVPIGSGLSSSASLLVSLAIALCRTGSLALEPLELVYLAQKAEHESVGVPVGIMDPACILLARSGHALLLDCTREESEFVPLPTDLSLFVVDSGVHHELANSEYATRRAELEAGHPGRLRHVQSENQRVLEAAAALETCDLETLGSLFRQSHESLRDDFDVSSPELDLLVDLAYQHRAVAARMTGGGFGGSVVVLARKRDARLIAKGIVAAYRAQTGIDARGYHCRTVDGAYGPAYASLLPVASGDASPRVGLDCAEGTRPGRYWR